LFDLVGVMVDGETVYGYIAGRLFPKGFDDLKRSGFSGAVGTKQTENFAVVYLEAYTFYGLKIAVFFYQVFNGNDRLFCHAAKVVYKVGISIIFSLKGEVLRRQIRQPFSAHFILRGDRWNAG